MEDRVSGSGYRYTPRAAEGGRTRGGRGLPYRCRYRGEALPLTWSPWKRWAAARNRAGQRPCCDGTGGGRTSRRRASGPRPQGLLGGVRGGESQLVSRKARRQANQSGGLKYTDQSEPGAGTPRLSRKGRGNSNETPPLSLGYASSARATSGSQGR